jgi:tRNA (guanine37-N1)-methyltransferase
MSSQLKIDLLTLFPEMISGFLSESIIGRARENGILDISVHNLRDWTTDKHHITDDRPFGGGAGMVLKPEPLYAAIEELRSENSTVILMAPDGVTLTSSIGKKLATAGHLILISGHYEGVDERIRENLVDLELSIGDYVLTNGTLPAAVLIDCVSRFVPDVLGDENSLTQDCFNENLLSFPQYTRPADYRGKKVPDVLLTGNHAEIKQWRDEQRFERTKKNRPDLISK